MTIRWFFLFCALCSFIAVINLPIGYYTFLRILLTGGALTVIIKGCRNLNVWTICFIIIAILFNPIFPVYFGQKIIWIPIDIITGILFLLIRFEKNEDEEPKKTHVECPDSTPIYKRDRIIKTIHTKKEKLK